MQVNDFEIKQVGTSKVLPTCLVITNPGFGPNWGSDLAVVVEPATDSSLDLQSACSIGLVNNRLDQYGKLTLRAQETRRLSPLQ